MEGDLSGLLYLLNVAGTLIAQRDAEIFSLRTDLERLSRAAPFPDPATSAPDEG